MVEYLNHHWCNAQMWAKRKGPAEKVARELIKAWNDPTQWDPDYGQPFRTYPESEEFIKALASIITAVRHRQKVTLLPDGPNGPPDALCLAHGGCGKKLR